VYPAMRSSSRCPVSAEIMDLTAGGAPPPLEPAMENSPTCVQDISSSADSKTKRTGTSRIRDLSHSAWSKSKRREQKSTSVSASAACTSSRRLSRSLSVKRQTCSPSQVLIARSAASA